jgi:hypothetical protein
MPTEATINPERIRRRVAFCRHFVHIPGPQPPAGEQVVYRPRDAEHTVLHQVVAEHREAFLHAAGVRRARVPGIPDVRRGRARRGTVSVRGFAVKPPCGASGRSCRSRQSATGRSNRQIGTAAPRPRQGLVRSSRHGL